MPRCPSCNQVYTDNMQIFCLNDGARLVSDQAAYDPQKTILAPPPRKTDPPLQPTQYVQTPYNQAPPQWQPGQPPQQWSPPPGHNWGGYYPQQPVQQAPYVGPYAQSAAQPITTILSMIFGCLSAFFGILGMAGTGVLIWPAFMFGAAGLVLGIVALNKVTTKGLALAGVSTSIFGLIMFLIRLF